MPKAVFGTYLNFKIGSQRLHDRVIFKLLPGPGSNAANFAARFGEHGHHLRNAGKYFHKIPQFHEIPFPQIRKFLRLGILKQLGYVYARNAEISICLIVRHLPVHQLLDCSDQGMYACPLGIYQGAVDVKDYVFVHAIFRQKSKAGCRPRSGISRCANFQS